MATAPDDLAARLRTVLGRSRELGLLGPGPVEEQLAHAVSFVPLVEGARRVLDLGSGGGLPGLVLAVHCPDLELVLLDASERRIAFLRDAVRELGVTNTTAVVGRAEKVARDPAHRERYDVVVARSFGRPAVTAECAVGFLTTEGRMFVSEPADESEGRWPAEGLRELSLVAGPVHRGDGATVQELRRGNGTVDPYPRPVGRPGRRPLF